MARTILDINGKFYEMEEEQAIDILKFGKEKLVRGIYGVYKDGYARCLIEKHDSLDELNEAIANYEWKGFTVLYNM